MAKIKIDENREDNKEILFDLMGQAGIPVIRVYFDGSGDDGSVDRIEVEPDTQTVDSWGSKEQNKFLDRVIEGARIGSLKNGWSYNPNIEQIIHDICYEVLEGQFGGWENDTGSCGEFVIRLATRKVELTMKQRYYEYEVDLYDF